jgi:hypothetical protein
MEDRQMDTYGKKVGKGAIVLKHVDITTEGYILQRKRKCSFKEISIVIP